MEETTTNSFYKTKALKINLKAKQVRKYCVGVAVFAMLLFGASVSNLIGSDHASAVVGINHQINFQGKLVNLNGTNVTDGTYSIVFSIYNVASGGVAIWTETQASTSVTNGIFQINLGSVTPLPGSVDFNTDNIYLGMKVGADAEMTPRIQFTSVPQAFNSEKLGGLDKTGFIQNQTGSTQTADFKISGTGNIGTSLTTPLLQAASATALTITGNAASTWSTSAGNIVLQAGSGTISFGSTTSLTASGALSITSAAGANAITLDSGSTGAVNVGTGTSAKTITLGNATGATGVVINSGTGNIALNGNTTISAGSYISLVGGITSTRPASPTAGMLYFDATTTQLLQYNGSKWVSAPRSTTKIVAASNATQAEKDAADYIATGTGDQATINTALSAATGGSVYLTEGTYSETAAISIPNNTTLFGAGAGTLITIPNAQNGSYNIIANTDTTTGTHVTIHDLQIDGNKSNQTSGTMYGVNFVNMGGGSGSTARAGANVTNITVKNLFGGSGILLNTSSSNNYIAGVTSLNNNWGVYVTNSSSNNTITDNIIQGNASWGLVFTNASYNTASSNIVQGNGGYGIIVSGNSMYDTINGNTVSGNADIGIYVNSTSNVTVTGNTLSGNASAGIDLNSSNSTLVSSNKIHDSSGLIQNNGIFLSTSSSNTITDNDITDTSCTTTCSAINISDTGSTSNYISNNRHSGTVANPSTINDAAPNTIYANQLDGYGNLINKSQGGGLAVGASTANATLSVQGGITTTALPVPTLSATVTTVGTAGATTYRYQVTALDGTGESLGSAVQQTTTGNATLSGTNYNTITWTTVGGAVNYKIYRCTGAACTPLGLATVTGSNSSFNDQAAGSPSGTAPVFNTTGKIGVNTLTPAELLSVYNGNLRVDYGNIIVNQVATPIAPNVAINVTAGNISGFVCYRVSFVTASGETDGSPISSCVSPSSQQVDLTAIPTGTAGVVTARRIYRAASNSSLASFKLVTTINDNSTTTYTDNIAAGSLGSAASKLNSTGGLYMLNGGNALSIGNTNEQNTFIGYQSLQGNTVGYNNTATGYQTLKANTSGSYNTANGYQALMATTSGTNNTGVGSFSLAANTSGTSNSGIGMYTLYSNLNGTENTASGYGALYTNVSGNYNTAGGTQSLTNATGSSNTGIGHSSGRSITTGANNTFLGYYAGYMDPTTNAFATVNSIQNAAAIGYGAQVQASNAVVIGGEGIYGVSGNAVNVGIGTTMPSNILSVSPDQYDTGTAGTGNVSSTLVTGVGTVWTTAMVGSEMIFANAQKSTITSVTSGTSLTLTTAVTVPAGTAYRIHYVSLQVTSSGNVGIGTASPGYNLDVQGSTGLSVKTTTNSSTALQVQNATSGTVLAVDTTANQLNIYGSLNLTPVVQPNPPTVTDAGAGTIGAGTYYYAYSYVTANGDTQMGPASSSITIAANHNITVTIANSPSSLVTSKNIFRSNSCCGGFGLVGSVANNTATSFTDNAVSTGAAGRVYDNKTASIKLNNSTVLSVGSNIYLGINAGNSGTTGASNVAVGNSTLQYNTSGLGNTAIGDSALQLNSSGVYNTAVGSSALSSNTSGQNNAAFGSSALQNSNGPGYNSAFGTSALLGNTTGQLNVGFGYYAGQASTTGNYNSAIGSQSLMSNTTGTSNTTIGANSLYYLKTLTGTITATATNAGNAQFTSSSTTGLTAGAIVTISGTTNYNGVKTILTVDTSTKFTISQAYSTADATGAWTTANTDNNTAVGYQAGQGSNGGYTAVGNALFGTNVGLALQTGADYNTLVGYSAGSGVTTGNSNILLGKNAGLNITSGSANIVIGTGVNAASATSSNQLQIGNAISGDLSTGTLAVKAISNNAASLTVQNSAGGQILGVDTTANQLNVAGNINLNQVTTPASAPTLVDAGAGSIGAGTYFYVYSYVTASGETDYGPVSASITIAASHNVTVTIANSPSALVTSRNVYRGTISSGPFYLVGTVNNNTGTTFTDNNNSPSSTASRDNRTALLRIASANFLNYSGANTNNLWMGLQSGQSNTTGQNNHAFGTLALRNNTTGNGNNAFGNNVLQNNTTGLANSGFGSSALNGNTTGNYNTAIGNASLLANTTGSQNIGTGSFTLNANTTGSGNTASGYSALSNNTTGSNNVGTGYQALTNSISGSYNTGTGYQVLYNLTTITGSITATANNASSAQFTTGSTTGLVAGSNVIIAGTTSYNGTRTILSVDSSTTFTIQAAYSTADATGSWTTASNDYNTAYGQFAGYGTSGSYSTTGNSLFGVSAGYGLQTGANYNTLVGYSAGSGVTTGNSNILLGKNAGLNITSGSNNIIIGAGVNAASATSSNQLNIGGLIQGNTSALTLTFSGATNTTGNAIFAGSIQGGTSITLGTASTVNGIVKLFSASNTGSISLLGTNTAGNYTVSFPSAITANDTICLQSTGNCGGGGVTTVGALNGGTANANGAIISGSTIYLQSASSSNAGLVDTTAQTFAGIKTFNGNLTIAPANSTTALQVQNAASSTILAVDTTANQLNSFGTINLSPIAAPASAPTFNAFIAAGSLTGSYYYVYTYVTASGETEYSTASSVMSPSAQNITINITNSPSTLVTYKNIYRATSSSGPFRLVGVVANNTTTTFTDSNTSPTTAAKDTNSTALLSVGSAVALNVGNTTNANTFVGLQAGNSNTSGINNTANGTYALNANTTGSNNTANGSIALYANTTGNQNTANGYYALRANTTGSNNTALGYSAGYQDPSVAGFATLTNLQNATAIGYGAQVQSSNSLILGGQDVNAVNVGIGTTIPSNTLSVSPVDTAAGTAGTGSISSTSVTGTSTAFAASMIGEQMIFGDGQSSTISAVASATSLTLGAAVNEANTANYRIHKIGLQVTGAGNVGISTSSPQATFDLESRSTGTAAILAQINSAGGDVLHIVSSGSEAGSVTLSSGSISLASTTALTATSYGTVSDATGVAKLDSSRFVTVHSTTGCSNSVIAEVGQYVGTSISYSSPTTISTICTRGSSFAVTALDSTHFVFAAWDGSTTIEAMTCTVTGTTIACGAFAVLESTGSHSAIALTTLDSTHFAMSYYNGSATKVAVASVSGTTTTWGTAVSLGAITATSTKITTMDSTHFVMAYATAASSSVVAGSVAGTTITLGSAVQVNASNTSVIDVASLTASTFALAHSASNNSNAIYTLTGSLSGTTITLNSQQIVNVSTPTATIGLSLIALSSSSLVLTYGPATTTIAHLPLSVNGSTFTVGSVATNATTPFSFVSTAALSSTAFVVDYSTSSSIANGYVGTTAYGGASSSIAATTAAGQAVTVTNAGESVFRSSGASNFAFQIQNASGSPLFTLDTAGNLIVAQDASGTNVLTIDLTNRRVGVGTRTPGTAFAVNGGNNLNPLYPDGLVGTPLATSTSSYTIPSDKTLYLYSIYNASASSQNPQINGSIFDSAIANGGNYLLSNPLPIAGGSVIKLSSNGLMFVTGYLTNSNGLGG